MALDLAAQLPGWQMVVFIVLVVTFLIAGGITAFVLMSRAKWPLRWVALEDTQGNGLTITKRGKCRIIGFGDGGEEILLLKHLNKYKVGFGKRIGNKQIGFSIGDDGLWYQFNFSDFNKTLREMGVLPTSVNVRLAMASVRKGLDKRLEPTDWMSKYGVLIGMGLLFFMFLVVAGGVWYFTEKQAEIANINSQSIEQGQVTQEMTQKTLSTLDNILSKIELQSQDNNAKVGGSGLTPAT